MYGKGVPAEEIDSLHQEFLNVVRKSGIVGSNLTMIRFRDFMVWMFNTIFIPFKIFTHLNS